MNRDFKEPIGEYEGTLAREIENKLQDWLTDPKTLTDDHIIGDLEEYPEVGDILSVVTSPESKSTVVMFFEYNPDSYTHPVNVVERITGTPKRNALENFYLKYSHNVPHLPVIMHGNGFYISCVSTDLLELSEFPEELLLNNVATLKEIALKNLERKVNPQERKSPFEARADRLEERILNLLKNPERIDFKDKDSDIVAIMQHGTRLVVFFSFNPSVTYPCVVEGQCNPSNKGYLTAFYNTTQNEGKYNKNPYSARVLSFTDKKGNTKYIDYAYIDTERLNDSDLTKNSRKLLAMELLLQHSDNQD